MTRDFDTKPYSADEERVAAYLRELLPEVGTGDDPIGFLIASHAAIVADRREAAANSTHNQAPTSPDGPRLTLFERMSRIAAGGRGQP